MKKIAIIALFFIAISNLSAQVTVDQVFTIEEYVNDILLGEGVEASNITFTGSEIQIGQLLNGDGTIFPMSEGLILSCSDAVNCDITSFGGDVPFGEGVSGEPDLLTIANSVPPLIGEAFTVGSVNDVCILEFDFIATGDFLSFNYSFGSDEYLTWVNSQYNDIFSFFLSGPGIVGDYASPAGFPDGAINIAQVPDSDPELPITISSVNNVTNSEYYIDNQPNIDIGLNGFTSLFEASHGVVCGETYHIKLAIADGTDNSLESVVVLEAGSFAASFTYIEANPYTEGSIIFNNDSTLVEGCNTGFVTFYRPTALDSDTIYFNILGDASPSDYTDIPDFVVLDSGQYSYDLSVEALLDGETEDLEELTFQYFDISECTGDTVIAETTLWIADHIEPDIIANDESILCEPVLLAPTLLEGFGPLTWQWGILPNDEVINDTPQFTSSVAEPTTYWVTVQDPCFFMDSINITVTPDPIPPIVLTAEEYIIDCPATFNDFTVNTEGGVGDFSYLWSNNQTTQTINLFNQGDQVLTVTVSDECFQEETLEIPVIVTQPDGPLALTISPTSTLCPGLTASLVGVGTGGYNANGYEYLWSTSSIESSINVSPESLGINEYSLTITDGCGNSTDAIGQVNVTFPQEIGLVTADELCVGLTTELTTSGGLEPLSFSTTEGISINANNLITGTVPGISTVMVSDGCGQSAEIDILIQGCEITIPNVFTPSGTVGFNDFFVIEGLENYENSKLMIFNRWGNLILEDSNYKNNWTAGDVAGGTYYYILERADGTNFSGYVEVMK